MWSAGTRRFSYSSQAAYTHLTGQLGPEGPQTGPPSDAASLLVPPENRLTFPQTTSRPSPQVTLLLNELFTVYIIVVESKSGEKRNRGGLTLGNGS